MLHHRRQFSIRSVVLFITGSCFVLGWFFPAHIPRSVQTLIHRIDAIPDSCEFSDFLQQTNLEEDPDPMVLEGGLGSCHDWVLAKGYVLEVSLVHTDARTTVESVTVYTPDFRSLYTNEKRERTIKGVRSE